MTCIRRNVELELSPENSPVIVVQEGARKRDVRVNGDFGSLIAAGGVLLRSPQGMNALGWQHSGKVYHRSGLPPLLYLSAVPLFRPPRYKAQRVVGC